VTRWRLRRRGPDDRGAILIIVSLSMVGILCMASIVIDLGMARSARRDDQAIADLAALSAGFFLSGHGETTSAGNPFEGCKAAYNSVKTNALGFTPTTTSSTACASFPTDNATCAYANPAMTPIYTTVTSGRFTLTIRYPIPESEISDARFNGNGANDGIDASTGMPDSVAQCQRMRVTFSQTNETTFARVIGKNSLATTATAVVRGTTSTIGQGIAALLMLERVNCATLQNSGQGSVEVKAPSNTNPGVIQSDSAGQQSPYGNCTTNSNAGGYAIYGPSLPTSVGGGQSILVDGSSNGTAGTIGVFALGLSPQGRGAASYPSGISVAPVAAPISSRQPIDTKYNGPSHQITNLHSTAYSIVNSNPAVGITTISGGSCNNNTVTNTATKIYIDCATWSPTDARFANATDVYVRGNVNIKNTGVLWMPKVQHFYVRGCSVGGCSGSNTFALNIQGELIINSGETSRGSPDPFANGTTCANRLGPGAGGSTTNWTTIATFGGSVSVTGQARMCQTFVYQGTNTSTYTRQAVYAAGQSPESYPSLALCATNVPCPKDNVEPNSFVGVTGGGAIADWSAPNQLSTRPSGADLQSNPFEDLALWNETSAACTLKGQGGNQTTGVYFLPNATTLFQGQGSQPITLNAQFLTRAINISGQGNFILNPKVNDSVSTPIAGNYSLIR
jgi:hypothetical protein